jgi:hypothetical protein
VELDLQSPNRLHSVVLVFTYIYIYIYIYICNIMVGHKAGSCTATFNDLLVLCLIKQRLLNELMVFSYCQLFILSFASSVFQFWYVSLFFPSHRWRLTSPCSPHRLASYGATRPVSCSDAVAHCAYYINISGAQFVHSSGACGGPRSG